MVIMFFFQIFFPQKGKCEESPRVTRCEESPRLTLHDLDIGVQGRMDILMKINSVSPGYVAHFPQTFIELKTAKKVANWDKLMCFGACMEKQTNSVSSVPQTLNFCPWNSERSVLSSDGTINWLRASTELSIW